MRRSTSHYSRQWSLMPCRRCCKPSRFHLSHSVPAINMPTLDWSLPTSGTGPNGIFTPPVCSCDGFMQMNRSAHHSRCAAAHPSSRKGSTLLKGGDICRSEIMSRYKRSRSIWQKSDPGPIIENVMQEYQDAFAARNSIRCHLIS